jgi:multidrug resistance efflux pump
MTVQPTDVIAGIIAPLQNVAITNALSEPALSVTVNEGDLVRAGEVLAVLDTTDLVASYESELQNANSNDAKTSETRYQAQLTFAQSPEQVQQARQTLVQAQHTLTNDQANLTRDKELLQGGFVAQQTVDQQQTLVNNDLASLRSANAALNSAVANQRVNGTPQQGLQAATIASQAAAAASARAQAQQTQAMIARATIVSPVDGVVVNRNLNPGEYPNGRTLFTIQEISRVYAELNASSADVFRIRKGAPVTLQAGDDQTEHQFHGHVVGVLGQVQPGSTNFTVKVIVENPGDRLQAGVPVTATISLPSATGVGVPSTAFLDDTRSSLIVAQVQSPNAKVAQLVHVREVASDGTNSIVTGLSAGTTVVSDGQLGITPGESLSGGPSQAGSNGQRRRRRPGGGQGQGQGQGQGGGGAQGQGAQGQGQQQAANGE